MAAVATATTAARALAHRQTGADPWRTEAPSEIVSSPDTSTAVTVGAAVGAAVGPCVATETPVAVTVAMAVEPSLDAYDETEDESDPELTAVPTELVTNEVTSPLSSVTALVGSESSIEIEADDESSDLTRRDPSSHVCAPNVALRVAAGVEGQKERAQTHRDSHAQGDLFGREPILT